MYIGTPTLHLPSVSGASLPSSLVDFAARWNEESSIGNRLKNRQNDTSNWLMIKLDNTSILRESNNDPRCGSDRARRTAGRGQIVGEAERVGWGRLEESSRVDRRPIKSVRARRRPRPSSSPLKGSAQQGSVSYPAGTITFGKYSQRHPCTVKDFVVLAVRFFLARFEEFTSTDHRLRPTALYSIQTSPLFLNVGPVAFSPQGDSPRQPQTRRHARKVLRRVQGSRR
jgi:hypothetical protein